MKLKHLLWAFVAAATITSCSDDTDEPGDGEQIKSGKYHLSGKVEKGPFVRGSQISVQPLNTSLNSVGTVFNGELQDDAGTFDLGQIELASQFVRISADGYFFNEVSGWLSDGTLHLVALADLSDRSSVNVNILTHLKSARIQKLMQGGKSFAEANKQTHKELLTQFGLQAYENLPAEGMTITSGNDGAGVLIAISLIILSDRSEAEITQYLSTLSQDLADDGSFTEDNKKSVFQGKNRVVFDLESISRHIIDRYNELGMNVTVPDLRYYFDWNNDGIAGNEINDNAEVKLSQEEVAFGKDGGTATVTVTSNVPLSLEKFSDPYGTGDFDVTPPSTSVEETFVNDFFIDEGKPIQCTYTFENNVLTIKVDKTQKRGTQTTSIPLYDMMGVCQGTVQVSLAGDPTIEIKLGEKGKQVVAASFSKFANALSWMYYVERGYTGMYKYYDIACPFNATNNYNRLAYNAAYQSAALNANFIKILQNSEYSNAAPFFKLLNAIVYTEMVDKWGRIGICESRKDEYSIPAQNSTDYTLRCLDNQLDAISGEFTDRKADSQYIDAEKVFDMSKDVWRIAKANVYMALGEHSNAAQYLQQIVDSRRYSVSSGNEYDPNAGTILHIIISDEVMPGHTCSYDSYADVLLMLAECNIATGQSSKAKSLIAQVANAKGISVIGSNIEDIASLRKQLFIPRYFAFQKRNNLGGYAAYQKLWPIPSEQISLSPGWTQNPGY